MGKVGKEAAAALQALRLTDRQRKLVLIYADHHEWPKEKCLYAAGYKAANGSAAKRFDSVMDRPEVREWLSRFDRAVEEKVEQHILSVAERKAMLTEIAAQNSAKSGLVAIKAIDVLNKMDSVYVQKMDVSGDMGLTLTWGGEDKDGS